MFIFLLGFLIGGFLNLVNSLRKVLLQDSVVLKKAFPRHPIWEHDLFQGDEYKQFELDLTAAMRAERDPTELRLEQAMPDLMAHLQASGQSVSQDLQMVKDLVTKNTQTVASLRTTVRNILNDVAEVVRGHLLQDGTISNFWPCLKFLLF